MVINYFGDGCFRLQSGETSLLLDPNNNRLKADIVVKTLSLPETPQNSNEISFPGEYEIKSIQIQGWPVQKESTGKILKTIYLVNWEDISFVFLGCLSNGLEPEIFEELTEADILFIPVGGGHFLSAELAAKLAKKLEPAAIIPSFFKNPNEFLKAIGQKAEVQEKFVFKKKDLAGLKTKVVVLKSAGSDRE